MATTNTLIRISRNSTIEESRAAAIRRLNEQFEHIVGQPVMVRYYATPNSLTTPGKIDAVLAIGVKNGKGKDCYQVVTAFNKSVIYGVTDDLKDLDISAFPSGKEVYIYISPDPAVSDDFEANKAYYVYKDEEDEEGHFHRTFKEIDDGPRVYEDLSTGRSIYLSDTNTVTLGNGYSRSDIDELLSGKIGFSQPEHKNKILKVNSEGVVEFVSPEESGYTAGKNIEINENYEISAPNVISQYTVLPDHMANLGSVVQYIGEEVDTLRPNRFYKATEAGWIMVSVQENWTNILVLEKPEYRELKENNGLDPDTLYFIKEGTEEDLDNTIFIYDICTTSMPEANDEYVNEAFIYIGETTRSFVKGHLYQCTQVGEKSYEWLDLTCGESISTSYQTFSENYVKKDKTQGIVNYINGENKASTYDTLEEMRKKIASMKSFSGVMKYGTSVTPIVRINAGIDKTDDNELKWDTFVTMTIMVLDNNYVYYPKDFVISANRFDNTLYGESNLKFFLTVVS